MSQRAKTSYFIFSELINIIFWPILSTQSELSLLYSKIAKYTVLFTFCIDDIFGASKTYKEQLIILHNHFFSYIVWSKLRFGLSKLKLGITKIFILGEKYEIGGKVRLMPDEIGKILTWSISQDQTIVKAFFRTIHSIQC